ncbi:ankyrin repeat domain-containing protein [Thecamonas trahens ATCC 50062]|uniref:Ankyrin repeat domain-containing protein n=1 Tax=Thecamonas trahens ATCC 50062 TaxID=461836 RepID=A0A0L0D6C6_THETB|nr:ankyrin repeat domain-containing protein [Thecamonas trahens ATCC 50062]KNC46868.1 ankyrin repeat domain-containing protein [Thecamonas trahens ATCC 50062]|eukprot:XP_013760141.1 ankyrin repeat domain-containing protein [Thecamonas trahens ATCC 50062]
MADVSELTTSPQVQLYAFARAGRLDAIQELFAADSALNVNAPDQTGKTPLHYAAQFGWPAVVGFLLEQGAEQSVCETTGDTPLHFAAFKGHTQVVRVLMEAGADPTVSNEDGKFPHQLCDEGGATHQVLFDAYSEAYAVDPADLEGSSEYSDDDDDEDDEDEE